MAIGHVELNVAMTGVQDYVSQRHHEETRSVVDQSNLQTQNERNVEVKITNVHESEDTNNRQKKFDAKEKGSNQYTGSGKGRDKDKKEEKDDMGKVVAKQYSSFDMKI